MMQRLHTIALNVLQAYMADEMALSITEWVSKIIRYAKAVGNIRGVCNNEWLSAARL
jgi:hypothetical protein